MCNAVIRFIEVKCAASKEKPPEENGLKMSLNIYCFHTFQNSREC